MLRSNMMSTFKSHMRAQYWILNLVATAIAASAAVIASAQEPQKQLGEKRAYATQDNQSDSIIVCSTFLPTINVSVTDWNNRPILELRHEDFAIFEDDVEQEVAFWFHDDSSVNFGLAFAISDDEPLKLMEQQAARSFVRQLRPADNVAIPQLKANDETVRDFAADERKLENALSRVSSKNQLAGLVAETIKSEREKSKDLQSAVVVITDGYSLSGAASDRDEA
jgi:hypothetical protein